jgi:hypothetical protein
MEVDLVARVSIYALKVGHELTAQLRPGGEAPLRKTQFILDAMSEASLMAEMRWEQVQESVDLLFAKLKALEASQQRMATQVDLTAQAIAWANQEHQALAQQLATTTEVVTWLVATRDVVAAPGAQGPQHGCAVDTAAPHNCPVFG